MGKELYKDLDLSFEPNSLTGDLEPLLDIDALKESVRRLVEWNALDLPFYSKIKANVKSYLFEQNTHIVRSSLEDDIRWIIGYLEPRVKAKKVEVLPTQDGRGFDISIVYMVQSLNREGSIQFVIERAR